MFLDFFQLQLNRFCLDINTSMHYFLRQIHSWWETMKKNTVENFLKNWVKINEFKQRNFLLL